MIIPHDKMVHLKQTLILVIVCFAFYVGLVLRVHELLTVNQRQRQNNILPLLEYKASPSPEEAVVSMPVLLEKSDDVPQEDVLLNQNSVQNSEYFHDVVQISQSQLQRLAEFKNRRGSEIKRDIHPSSDDTTQRSVRFVNVGGIYVYGAYLDLRQKGNFTVRILALKHDKLQDGLVCHIADGEKHLVLYAQAYRTCENHGKTYEGWIYSCVLPKTLKTLPSQISVFPISQRQNRSKAMKTLNLKTIPSEINSRAEQIGVCVPPLFGNLSLSPIINFIQMCKVLGADKIFMYLGAVSSEIKKYLEFHSQSDSSLSVIHWNLPENLSDSEDKIWYHGQLLAVQDCLYHNMDSFSFLLFMDLDEMLVPQVANDWREMLEKIFTTQNRDSVAALSFKSAFIDPAGVPEDSENILYFQHLHRTRSVSTVRKKLLVQPLKVFELGIHHLSKALSDDCKSVDVSEKNALLHHYHMCVKAYDPQMKCYLTKKDKRILRYKEKLTQLSHRAITDASRLFA
ncbi:beta-1,4-galactosyltransferase galt-1-like [Littorina saxatilis]|uniref:beta-1,4-galactosyltransferase galt-1-like n=1 Tax=Littorina saxatilis TaxID=31220 RepID=UPI0038B422C7